MKKTIWIFTAAAVLLLLCAVQAFAATPAEMTVSVPPDKTSYTDGDALLRTELAWDEAAGKPVPQEFFYYPVDFTGLELTFTMADGSTQKWHYDDAHALVSAGYTIEYETQQAAGSPWLAGKQTVLLRCGTLTASFEVLVQTGGYTALAITTPPQKTTYYADTDALLSGAQPVYTADLTGMVYTLTSAAGTEQYTWPDGAAALRITDDQAQEPWLPGAHSFTLHLRELTAVLPVTVAACAPSARIQSLPATLQYALRDIADGSVQKPELSGLVIAYTDSSGSTSLLGAEDITAAFPENISTPGIYEVQLVAKGIALPYSIRVLGAEDPVAISVITMPHKTVYMPFEAVPVARFENGAVVTAMRYKPELEGMLLRITYQNGSTEYAAVTAADSLLLGSPLTLEDGQDTAAWATGKHTLTLHWRGCSTTFTVIADEEGHAFASVLNNGDDTHTQTCSICEGSFTEACAGGTATCTQRAVCAVCKVTYGKEAPHSYALEYNTDLHWGSCTACGTVMPETAHTLCRGEYHADTRTCSFACADCAYSTQGRPVGDVDGDGLTTAADARLALRASVQLETLSEVDGKAADADGDASITAADARHLLRASVHLESQELGVVAAD